MNSEALPTLYCCLLPIGLVILVLALLVTDSNKKKRERQDQKRRIDELAGGPVSTRAVRDRGINMIQQDLFACMSEMAKALDKKLDDLGLPKASISSPKQVFAAMSPQMRQKMAIHVNQVFAQGAANMVNLELEAILKMAELIHRLEFYQQQKAIALHKVMVDRKFYPELLREALKGAHAIESVYLEFERTDGPMKPLIDAIAAQTSVYLFNDFQESLGRPDTEALEGVKRLMTSSAAGRRDKVDQSDDVIDGEIDEIVMRKNGRRST